MVILLSPLMFERNRASWLPQWEPAWRRFLETEPTRIAVFYDDSRQEGWPTRLPVSGRTFQNDVMLLTKDGFEQGKRLTLDYVVRLANPLIGPNPEAATQDIVFLQRQGYTLELATDYVVIAAPTKSEH